jgi:hypothetical protein
MNELGVITLAMAAGAAAYFRPIPFAQKRPEVAAYLALRQLLGDRYPAVSNDILDIGPASVERQNVQKTQLEKLEHEQRNRTRYSQHSPNTATPAYL